MAQHVAVWLAWMGREAPVAEALLALQGAFPRLANLYFYSNTNVTGQPPSCRMLAHSPVAVCSMLHSCRPQPICASFPLA